MTFEVPFRRPYDWSAMLSFLGARAVAGVEENDGIVYRRSLRVVSDGCDRLGWIEITPAKGKSALSVTASGSLTKANGAITDRVARLMDVAASPRVISNALGPLAAANPGLRVPGAVDGFEIGVRAILGQQVTVAAARTVAGRFAAAFGNPIETPSASIRTVFPTAQRVAELNVDKIARLGVIAARSRSILALARAIADEEIVLEPGADPSAEVAKLRALPGIGEWTAQYIAMRALGWRDAFPHTDYGVMKAMGESNPRRVLNIAEAWRPWRSYAVMHLWHSLHRVEV
jgi:AraC family transcriptional regulator of adaptative response / DNA-3-methyladenine glycosylase II